MSTGTDAVQNSDCEFRQAGPGIFIRRCIGFEERTAKAGKDLTMFVGGSSAVQVRYRAGGQGFDLRRALASTWTLLRLDAPFMATVTEKCVSTDTYEFRYKVPRSAADVDVWIKSTLFFSNIPRTLFHAQQENQATVSSYISTGRYSAELFICPVLDGGKNELILCFQIGHHAIDGGGILQLITRFLERFSELTEGKGVMANIEWGEEVARLPPAIAISLLGKDGIRNAIRQEAAEPAPPAAPGVLTAMDWIPKHAVSGSIAAMIVLRRTAAAKLRDTYKRQGWTLADVLTTMSVVAQLQTALDVSRMKGADYFTDIRAAYEKAPAYIIPIYAVDTRRAMSADFQKITGDNRPPMLGMETSMIVLPLANFKPFIDATPDRTGATRSDPLLGAAIEDLRKTTKKSKRSLASSALNHASTSPKGRVQFVQNLLRSTPSVLTVSLLGNLGHPLVLGPFLSADESKAVRVVGFIGNGTNHSASLLGTQYELGDSWGIGWNSGGGPEASTFMRSFVHNFKLLLDAFIGMPGASILQDFSYRDIVSGDGRVWANAGLEPARPKL